MGTTKPYQTAEHPLHPSPQPRPPSHPKLASRSDLGGLEGRGKEGALVFLKGGEASDRVGQEERERGRGGNQGKGRKPSYSCTMDISRSRGVVSLEYTTSSAAAAGHVMGARKGEGGVKT